MEKEIANLTIPTLKIFLQLWDSPDKAGFVEFGEGPYIQTLLKRKFIKEFGKVGDKTQWVVNLNKGFTDDDITLMRRMVSAFDLKDIPIKDRIAALSNRALKLLCQLIDRPQKEGEFDPKAALELASHSLCTISNGMVKIVPIEVWELWNAQTLLVERNERVVSENINNERLGRPLRSFNNE